MWIDGDGLANLFLSMIGGVWGCGEGGPLAFTTILFVYSFRSVLSKSICIQTCLFCKE